MIRNFKGKTPKITESTFISETAYIVGDVEIGDSCIIGAGCLIGEGMKVPDDSFVAGVSGKIKGKPSEHQLWWVRERYKVYAELARQYRDQGL
ncbi:MAG: hypothetical protein MUO68_06220 [Desulfobacteraceae bacterium]|nr:hypothetical protein [Desulfobacteraceae bacterium]